MTDDASAKRTRPKNFPAAIPRTMTTEAQRAAIDDIAENEELGTGAAVRYLVQLGIEAYVEL